MGKPIKKNTANEKDYLFLNLRELPYFRGLLRAVEARFYQQIDLPQPVLDVGSGDGQFASVAFDRILDVGIDPWWEPTREASNRGGYKILLPIGRKPYSLSCGFFRQRFQQFGVGAHPRPGPGAG